ncbi:MAG TPA: hypothetical protein PLF30_02560 [Candidatus Moranbacteria bacterium]|jgi:hydrogenase maturation protein HypF|nr:hypothetical protein [Candidatus Moranbacteria bacterium]HOF42337.1 hypothetical protein [Candidatus Moranbacteria bacterium]HPX94413.1 hypothetical protein [Candidatus Moranbacteria bacterium]HQB59423.1 hypothetical protein [Candidatus Moranbacteria bacterium]
METIKIPIKSQKTILALGAESAGNFSAYHNGRIWFSQDFQDLLDEKNFKKYSRNLQKFLKDNLLKPDVVISDFHPEFRTTELAKKLSKKYGATHLFVQHHLAHIFSSIGDWIISKNHRHQKLSPDFFGIACDGTGYGVDGKIWGGEVFKIKIKNGKLQTARIGHLENQTLIGSETAIREPARVLIAILSKFLDEEKIYEIIKKYYSQKEFDVIYRQLMQNFYCIESSGAARVFDAVSILLGFSKNERLSKHAPARALEKNSTSPYKLKPVTVFSKKEKAAVLKTAPLFKFLIKNIKKDKRRLAATAQTYVAEGLLGIAGKNHLVFFSGGMANNMIMRKFFKSRGAHVNEKIPCSDAGISFGQIIFHLLADSRNHFSARHLDRAK